MTLIKTNMNCFQNKSIRLTSADQFQMNQSNHILWKLIDRVVRNYQVWFSSSSTKHIKQRLISIEFIFNVITISTNIDGQMVILLLLMINTSHVSSLMNQRKEICGIINYLLIGLFFFNYKSSFKPTTVLP